ncbi:AI-2E family transporter [Oscillochloris sp. ZM17-4]|uniref:AI-2E family transporter n=1 Tax=Oscillochloris sp. ZM17-4 TaxID=2866714 RepID=UPI001C72BFE2|nr:AI-2E family transporter [Oscillochloris sp. ZM17-4]MBX0326528.1 AI-2E family transporter [Oscillochloris sp. ZM17-4]
MSRVQNTVVVLVGVAVAWWLLREIVGLLSNFADVLTIFGLAWLLNLLLEPMVDHLSRWVKRPVAWALGYLSLILVLAALSAPLASQASSLPAALPNAIEQATLRIDDLLSWLRDHRIGVPISSRWIVESGQLAQQAGPTVLAWSLSLLTIGGQTLLVIGVAAAMSAGDDSLRAIIGAAIPRRWADDVKQLYDDVRRTYSAAIRGQLAIWAIGMALSLGVLAIFQTPGMLLWFGPLAIVRLLPYLGGILGGVMTAGVLLISLPWPESLLPVLLIVVGENLKGYIVEPRLLGRVLSLSPGLVLFVVLLGWKIGGVTGIAFGVPAMAVVQALAERVLSRREARRAAHPEEEAAPAEAAGASLNRDPMPIK